MLQIAPSTYYERRAIARDPDRASRRAKSDADLCIKIDAAWKDNRKLYGARKIWHVLLRDNQDVARCTVERLMRHLGLKGVLRGKKVITTNPDTSQPCPDDKVNRLFMADRPNKLWVSDFTYVQTWSGTVYVAFVIDVFARRIVGWRASTSMKTQFVLDALEQAIWQRKTSDNKSLVHHSDRGSQGGFKRSSQRFQIGGCDDKPQTRFGAQHTNQAIFTRAAPGGVTFSTGHILGTDQTRRFQRRSWRASWCVCPSWQSLVPRGRRHATIKVCTFISAAFWPVSLFC
jgi:hypothetical protein